MDMGVFVSEGSSAAGTYFAACAGSRATVRTNQLMVTARGSPSPGARISKTCPTRELPTPPPQPGGSPYGERLNPWAS